MLSERCVMSVSDPLIKELKGESGFSQAEGKYRPM